MYWSCFERLALLFALMARLFSHRDCSIRRLSVDVVIRNEEDVIDATRLRRG